MKTKALVLAAIMGLTAPPAKAAIPVVDEASIAQLVAQINNQLHMIQQFATQIQHLSTMTDLATVSGMTLGESIGPEAGGLFNELQQTYAAINRAHGSIMRVPGNVEAELSLFEGLDQLTFPQLVARAQRIHRLTAGTSSAALANSAEITELRARIMAQQAAANGMADRSVSAVSAIQAVAQQHRVLSQQADLIERNTASIDNTIALQQAQQEAERDAIQTITDADQAGLRELAEGAPGRPQHNPITMGR